jgi:hypothetical protein
MCCFDIPPRCWYNHLIDLKVDQLIWCFLNISYILKWLFITNIRIVQHSAGPMQKAYQIIPMFEWVIIGIRPIVCALVTKYSGTWECIYLIVEYFSQYLDKCGNGVEVSSVICCHHFLTSISNMFQHCNLFSHNSPFKNKP